MGLEPTTFGVTDRRSNQLNYEAILTGVTGLEPVDAGIKIQCVDQFHHTPKFKVL